MLRLGPLELERDPTPAPETVWCRWVVSDPHTLNWGAARTLPGALWDYGTSLVALWQIRRRKGKH